MAFVLKALFILAIIATSLVAEENCDILKREIEDFTSEIEALKDREPDAGFYQKLDLDYFNFSSRIRASSCSNQIDSLRMMLMLYYSEFVVKPQGDLERYRILMNQCQKLMETEVQLLGAKLDAIGESRDEIRIKWAPRLDHIRGALAEIDRNYKPMTVKIVRDNGEIFTEMTSVLAYDGKDYHPVQVHFRAPKDIYSDDVKRRRLEYLSSRYALILTSYNSQDGFFFDIPLVPVSNNMRTRPEDTYAITFNQDLRYRVNNFNLVNQDTLNIEPNKNWTFRSLVPTSYTKIKIPTNLDYYIYDRNQNIIVDKDFFTVVSARETSNLYLPNDPDLNYELRLQSKSNRTYLFFVTLISLALMIGGGVYVNSL